MILMGPSPRIKHLPRRENTPHRPRSRKRGGAMGGIDAPELRWYYLVGHNQISTRAVYNISFLGSGVKGGFFMEKTRYWVGVLYPENMRPDWEAVIGDLLQLPFAYCIHSEDHNINGEDRKRHVHVMLAWPGPTTKNSALATFNRLSAPGRRAINTCEPIISMRHQYDYLIHDTDAARAAGKYVYPASARIEGNNFDIGCYEQLSETEKDEIYSIIEDFIHDNSVVKLGDVRLFCSSQGSTYLRILRGNSAYFQRLCDSEFQSRKENK